MEYAGKYRRLPRYRRLNRAQCHMLCQFCNDVSSRVCTRSLSAFGFSLFFRELSHYSARGRPKPSENERNVLLRESHRDFVLSRIGPHICSPFFRESSRRKPYLQIKVQELLLYLMDFQPGQKALPPYFSQQTELIKEIHHQLTTHLDQRFTIEELSKQYLINTSTLKEVFKAVYGLPIATYMKEYRIREAMKLLRESDATIAEIACKVGYGTQGKFSEAFKDVVQMLPTAYRKSHNYKVDSSNQ